MSAELGSLVGGDGSGNDGSGDTAGTAQLSLGWDENVWNVLIFAEQWEMEEDLEWGGVGGHDDELGDTTVEGLGGLVGSLLELAVVGGLLSQVEDLLGEGCISEREGCELNVSNEYYRLAFPLFSTTANGDSGKTRCATGEKDRTYPLGLGQT